MKKLLSAFFLIATLAATSQGYVKLRLDSNDEILGLPNPQFTESVQVSTGAHIVIITATDTVNYGLMFDKGILAPYMEAATASFGSISSTGPVSSPLVTGTTVQATSLLEALGIVTFPSQSLDGVYIKNNEITSTQLADDITVTTIGASTATIANLVDTLNLTVTGVIDFPAQSLDGADIKNNEITSTQLADDIAVDTITGSTVTATTHLEADGTLNVDGLSSFNSDMTAKDIVMTESYLQVNYPSSKIIQFGYNSAGNPGIRGTGVLNLQLGGDYTNYLQFQTLSGHPYIGLLGSGRLKMVLPLHIGDAAATPSYATGDGDLYVHDVLEVNGNSYFDGQMDVPGGIIASSNWRLGNDIELAFGPSSPNDFYVGKPVSANELRFGRGSVASDASKIAFRITDSTFVAIGDGGTIDYVDGQGDLYVEDEFEVDGVSRFGASALFNGLTLQTGTLQVNNDRLTFYGTTGPFGYGVGYVTSGAKNEYQIVRGNLLDSNVAFRVLPSTSVAIGGSGTINYATGQGDLYVQDVLEVDGQSYFGGTMTSGFGYMSAALIKYNDDVVFGLGNSVDYSMGYHSASDEFRIVDGSSLGSNLRAQLDSAGNWTFSGDMSISGDVYASTGVFTNVVVSSISYSVTKSTYIEVDYVYPYLAAEVEFMSDVVSNYEATFSTGNFTLLDLDNENDQRVITVRQAGVDTGYIKPYAGFMYVGTPSGHGLHLEGYGGLRAATQGTADYDFRTDSDSAFQLGDGSYSWNYSPEFGVEGTAEFDGDVRMDNNFYSGYFTQISGNMTNYGGPILNISHGTTTGVEGQPLIRLTDNRTGSTSNSTSGEATLRIVHGGAVGASIYADSSIHAGNYMQVNGGGGLIMYANDPRIYYSAQFVHGWDETTTDNFVLSAGSALSTGRAFQVTKSTYVMIGDGGTQYAVDGQGDLWVGDELEVAGITSFYNTVTFRPNLSLQGGFYNGYFNMRDNYEYTMGTDLDFGLAYWTGTNEARFITGSNVGADANVIWRGLANNVMAIGDTGTIDYAANSGDLYVEDHIEVDGSAFINGAIQMDGSPAYLYFVTNDVGQIIWGTGGEQMKLRDHTYAGAGLQLLLSANQNKFMIGNNNYQGQNYDWSGVNADPSMRIYSGQNPDVDNTQWFSMQYSSASDRPEFYSGDNKAFYFGARVDSLNGFFGNNVLIGQNPGQINSNSVAVAMKIGGSGGSNYAMYIPSTVNGEYVRIGDGGTLNYAEGRGDLYVQDELEVDAMAHFQSFESGGYAITGGGANLAMANDIELLWGSSNNRSMGWRNASGAMIMLSTAVSTADSGAWQMWHTASNIMVIGDASSSLTYVDGPGDFYVQDELEVDGRVSIDTMDVGVNGGSPFVRLYDEGRTIWGTGNDYTAGYGNASDDFRFTRGASLSTGIIYTITDSSFTFNENLYIYRDIGAPGSGSGSTLSIKTDGTDNFATSDLILDSSVNSLNQGGRIWFKNDGVDEAGIRAYTDGDFWFANFNDNTQADFRITNVGIVAVGDGGSIDYSDGQGDLYVEDEAEIDGDAHLWGQVAVNDAIGSAQFRVRSESNQIGIKNTSSGLESLISQSGSDLRVVTAANTYMSIGTPSVSYAEGPGDLYIQDELEIAGRLFHTGDWLYAARGTSGGIAIDNNYPTIKFRQDGASVDDISLAANDPFDQFVLAFSQATAASRNHGNQFIIGGNATQDYDHAVQTNPTLYVHSKTNPDTSNLEWVSMTHNGTNAIFDEGRNIGMIFQDRLYIKDASDQIRLYDDEGTPDANDYLKIGLNNTGTMDISYRDDSAGSQLQNLMITNGYGYEGTVWISSQTLTEVFNASDYVNGTGDLFIHDALEVEGNAYFKNYIRMEPANRLIFNQGGSGDNYLYPTTGDDLVLFISNTQTMRWDDAGYIKVGSETPTPSHIDGVGDLFIEDELEVGTTVYTQYLAFTGSPVQAVMYWDAPSQSLVINSTVTITGNLQSDSTTYVDLISDQQVGGVKTFGSPIVADGGFTAGNGTQVFNVGTTHAKLYDDMELVFGSSFDWSFGFDTSSNQLRLSTGTNVSDDGATYLKVSTTMLRSDTDDYMFYGRNGSAALFSNADGVNFDGNLVNYYGGNITTSNNGNQNITAHGTGDVILSGDADTKVTVTGSFTAGKGALNIDAPWGHIVSSDTNSGDSWMWTTWADTDYSLQRNYDYAGEIRNVIYFDSNGVVRVSGENTPTTPTYATSAGGLYVKGTAEFASVIYFNSHLAATAEVASLGFTGGDGIYWRGDYDQVVWYMDNTAASGNQVIFGDYNSRNKDFDHAPQTNPTIFIHSAKDPDVDNTQWFSMAFSSANDRAEFDLGGGHFWFDGVLKTQAGYQMETGWGLYINSGVSNGHKIYGNYTYDDALNIQLDATNSNNAVIITDTYYQNHDIGDHTDPHLYVFGTTPPDTDNTQWVSLAFNSALDQAELKVGDSRPLIIDSTIYPDWMSVNSSGNQIYFANGSGGRFHYFNDYGLVLGLHPSDAGSNYNFIIGDYTYANKNYDHTTASLDPTLIMHSSQDPDIDNTQWFSLMYSSANDQAEYRAGNGKGLRWYTDNDQEAFSLYDGTSNRGFIKHYIDWMYVYQGSGAGNSGIRVGAYNTAEFYSYNDDVIIKANSGGGGSGVINIESELDATGYEIKCDTITLTNSLITFGSDGYMRGHPTTANAVQIVSNGGGIFNVEGAGINIPSTYKFNFDGSPSGNTYMYESASDILTTYAGGSKAWDIGTDQTNMFNKTTISQSVSGSGNYIASITNTNGSTDAHGMLVKACDSGSGVVGAFIRFERPDGALCGAVAKNGSTAVNYLTTSDIRYKTNIASTTYGLDDLMQIDVIDYTWDIDESTDTYTGMSAQALYDIYPEAVYKPADEETGIWSIDYGKLTPLLIETIQDLKGIIDGLETRIEALEP